jgi:hypothetical protein
VTTASSRPASARQGLLARHPLVSYFPIAFTWTPLFSVLLSKDGPGLLPYGVSPALARLIAPASLLGPSVAAFIVTGATEGGAGIGRLLRRIVRWRVGLRWYLFVLVGLPVVMVLGTLLRPGALASLDISAVPSGIAYLGREGGWAIGLRPHERQVCADSRISFSPWRRGRQSHSVARLPRRGATVLGRPSAIRGLAGQATVA